MGAPNPPFMPEPFANDAGPTFRNVIPDTTLDTQRASYSLGFPPLTMTSLLAGGKPMLGPDMNGVLFEMCAHLYAQQAGQIYAFSPTVAAAIGGYRKGALVAAAGNEGVWQNLVDNNTENPDTTATFTWVPLFRYGQITFTNNGGVLTLTPQEASYDVIIVNGNTVANVTIVLPPWQRSWLLINSTTGAFPVIARTTAGGHTVTLAPLGPEGPQGVYGLNTGPGGVQLYQR